eukprot:scaffold128639_cov29-Prasinocladus_malaysianus.AAC.1
MLSPSKGDGAISPVHHRHVDFRRDPSDDTESPVVPTVVEGSRRLALEVTIDEAMQKSAQLCGLPAALQIMVMVFTNIDPVVQRWFKCLPDGDAGTLAACEALVNTTGVDISVAFCELPSDAYEWTR